MSITVLNTKPPGETSKLTFDFISKLAVGETLSTATVTAAVWSGVDATPSAVISGAASISGTKATQMVTGGVNGCIYKITCTVTTSAGQTLVMYGYMPVVGDPI